MNDNIELCFNCKYYINAMPSQGFCLKNEVDTYDLSHCGYWEVEDENI